MCLQSLTTCTACNRYVTDKDLEFFKERMEQPGEVQGAGQWEHMVYKDFGSFTYEAWRRSLTVRLSACFSRQLESVVAMLWEAAGRPAPGAFTSVQIHFRSAWKGAKRVLVHADEHFVCLQNGKTEYKSVTVAEDSTAEEFMDFYLDDDTRTTWVSITGPSHLQTFGKLLHAFEIAR